tara:strand:+ start:242 stop:445 length:204 start_codon:yes stop_codon:yes gene_type:complete
MKQTALIFITGIICFNIGIMVEYSLRYDEIRAPKVELPEEYKAIDSTDCLKGYFDKDSVLHIEFNNR